MMVPRLLTKMTRTEIRSALAVAHREAFGEDASPYRLAIATCQVWLESGNGTALWCYNYGNVDAVAGWDGDTFRLKAAEIIRGRRTMMTKTLCAFPSAEAGAAHQWRRLATHYPTALEAFDSGDGEAAARALKAARYFTGPVEGYASTMAALVREYWAAYPEGTP